MHPITSSPTPLPVRQAAACAAATLVAYVGVVHEVVGTVLYPDGPLELGGPIAWHGLGLLGIAVGLLLMAGTFGLLRVPLKLLATGVAFLGGIIAIAEAVLHGGFHFFAFTVVLAGGVLLMTQPSTHGRSLHAT